MQNFLGPRELKIMRKAGRIAAFILKSLKKKIRPGVSTRDIECFFDNYLAKYSDMKPAFKGFRGYPSSICVSVNEEIIHGIPCAAKIIHTGDIVSVDLGIEYKGLFVDAAYTYIIGKTQALPRQLVRVTRDALYKGISVVKAGAKVGDISAVIQKFVEANGFSVIRKFVGHGIGKALHLLPEIPNFGCTGQGDELREGMVIAIEPMVAAGSFEVEVLRDGWTAKTRDNSLSAHFEHTIAVTRRGPRILTQ